MARSSALGKRGKTVDPTIEAARLTVIGTVLVALISSPLLTKMVETALAAAPAAQAVGQVASPATAPTLVPTLVPTATIQPQLPMLLPTATATVAPIDAQQVKNTETQIVVPLLPGEDWQTCVNATLWQTYPAVKAERPEREACLSLAENGIYADEGALRFYNSGRVDYDLYGISTPLPVDAVVEFTLTIDELKSDQVWVGYTEKANPWNRAWFLVFKPGGYIDIREVNGTSPNPVLRNYMVRVENNTYHVRLELTGNRPTVFVNGTRLMPNGVVSFSQRNLFLGYMAAAGPEIVISAGISNLVIEKK